MGTAIWGVTMLALASISFCVKKWRRRRIIEVLQGDSAQTRRPRTPSKNSANHEHFLWGCEYLSDEEASNHFLVLGSTGSGKTINILLLLQSVVARMQEPGSDLRAIVYDAKTDLLSSIRGAGVPEDDLLILNPFDERRVAWDIAKDITTPDHAEDLASVLAPVAKGSASPYFGETAQALLKGMIIAFQQNAAGSWTLRDLVLAARDSADIKRVLGSCRYTEKLLSHFRVKETSENVVSSLATKLDRFDTIAGSWAGAEKTFTISDWLRSHQVLVLGNSPKAKKPIRAINQLLFSSIAKEILDTPGRAKAKHWFFLDELRELGVLEMLGDLMTVGRSKGASLVLGFQDINGLFHEYGCDKAKEIIGQAGNFALLRINATQPESQKWASQVAGRLRYRERKLTTGRTTTDRGVQHSNNYCEEERTDDIYIPSYFSQEIPKTSLERGMRGIYYTKGNLFEQPIPGNMLFREPGQANRVPDRDERFADYTPLQSTTLLVEPWNSRDLRRLGLEITRDSPTDECSIEGFWENIKEL